MLIKINRLDPVQEGAILGVARYIVLVHGKGTRGLVTISSREPARGAKRHLSFSGEFNI